MSGANFILAINLFVAGVMAAAFMAIAVYDSGRRAARWLALGYVLGVAYLLVEASIPAFGNARLMVVASFAVFLCATIAFNVGLARKYQVSPPLRTMLCFLAVASLAVYLVQDMPRQSQARMMTYQLPYAAMQFIGFGIVWVSAVERRRLDWLLLGTLAVSAMQFASKPFIAHALGGWGANPQAYLQTRYAMASQALGTVFSLSIALLVLAILVRDVLVEATLRSEADALSRLLNRGGFQNRAAAALHDALHRGARVSLVIADLDHFKAINDSFGHASGDRVIECFAGFLRMTAARHHVIGRIGGEEFAVLLPGTNLAAARLFAEGIRSTFATLPVVGLPPDHRCSASFGVAELQLGESLEDLMRRADDALYGAKKAGRDQVRVAAGPAPRETGMPARGERNFSGRG
jgi:diguanylate cyclase (GGDEF)-like protein